MWPTHETSLLMRMLMLPERRQHTLDRIGMYILFGYTFFLAINGLWHAINVRHEKAKDLSTMLTG